MAGFELLVAGNDGEQGKRQPRREARMKKAAHEQLQEITSAGVRTRGGACKLRGVSTVIVSYSSWNGIKMHANRNMVISFLKNTLKFRGFVISDWQDIDRITSPPHANYSYSIEAGIYAGIDIVGL
ncbi:hypothetical protein Droror1_Dr00004435 [Drosera rotundifolia]